MAQFTPPVAEHIGNGTETVFGYAFPYLSTADVAVTVDGATATWVPVGTAQVYITPAPVTGAVIRIYRNTPAQFPEHDFKSGVPMLPRYLDENSRQLLYALQEGLLEVAAVVASVDNAEAAAVRAAEAAARAEAAASETMRDIRRTLRVPGDELAVNELPPVAGRAGKVLGFDSAGNPVGTLPATGSATELALDLADKSVPSKGAGMVGYVPPGTGTYGRTVTSVLGEWNSILNYIPEVEHAAIAAGTSTYDCTSALVQAAERGVVYAPAGRYGIINAVGPRILIQGAGEGLTEFYLLTSGLASLIDAPVAHVADCTLTDLGRPTVDLTIVQAAFLVRCTTGLRMERAKVVTNHAVTYQVGTTPYSYAIVSDVQLSRFKPAVNNEAAELNMFVGSGVRYVEFDNLRTNNLVGRSLVNYTYIQPEGGVSAHAVASVTRCQFNLFRKLGTAGELKCIFLGGYHSITADNDFVDCFGRHVDVLSNYVNAATLGVIYPNVIARNRVSFSTLNAAIVGAGNDEPGSLYCRYAEVVVSANYLDFTNLALVSNIYSGVSVRHGFNMATVEGNTIINPRACGVDVDLSDAIDTPHSSVVVHGNRIDKHTNRSRYAIRVQNTSATKVFRSIAVLDNNVDSTNAQLLLVDTPVTRTSSYCSASLTVHGNWHSNINTYDTVLLWAFPQAMYAPNTDVVVGINPSTPNGNGTVRSATDALRCIDTYAVRTLTVELASAVSTEVVVAGPVAYTPKCALTIAAASSAGGKLRFSMTTAAQTNLALNLSGQAVAINGAVLSGVPGVTVAALCALFGHGHVLANGCTFRDARTAVESRGPDYSVVGGSVDGINSGNSGARAVVTVNATRLVQGMLHNVTGAGNTRLYNHITPAVLVHQGINLGTLEGLKTSTTV